LLAFYKHEHFRHKYEFGQQKDGENDKICKKKTESGDADKKNQRSCTEPDEGSRICRLSSGIAQAARGATDRAGQRSSVKGSYSANQPAYGGENTAGQNISGIWAPQVMSK
jgi:hypothetical protein